LEPPKLKPSVNSTEENKNGPGATARPISSKSTAMSSILRPSPPCASGTNKPVHPCSDILRCNSRENPSGSLYISRTNVGGHSRVRNSRADCCSISCSSDSPKSIPHPSHFCHPERSEGSHLSTRFFAFGSE